MYYSVASYTSQTAAPAHRWQIRFHNNVMYRTARYKTFFFSIQTLLLVFFTIETPNVTTMTPNASTSIVTPSVTPSVTLVTPTTTTIL